MIAPYVALLYPPMRQIGSERQISAGVCPRAALDDPRARDDDDDEDDDDEKELCATADGDRATLDDSRGRLCTARAFVCAPRDATRAHSNRFRPREPRENNLNERVDAMRRSPVT